MSEPAIMLIDPHLCHPAPGNRPFEAAKNGKLLESIRQRGQEVPGIVFHHPELPKEYLVADGNQRCGYCKLLGVKFRAELRPEPYSEAEALKIRLTTNSVRKNASAFEMLKDAERLMALKGIERQADLAAELGFSQSQVSRILSPIRVPEELRPAVEQVCASITYLIATLDTTEEMATAFKRAIDESLSRDQVARMVNDIKDARNGSRKEKRSRLKGRFEGRLFEIELFAKDLTDDLVAWAKSLIAKLAKHREIPPPGLGFLFGS